MQPVPPYGMAPPPSPIAKFDIGWVIEKGFGTFFKNFPAFFLMALLVYAPLIVYATMVKYPLADATDPIQALRPMLTLLLALSLATMILQPLLAGMVTFATVERLSGRAPSFGRCLGVGLSRLVPSVVVGVLVAICVIVGVLGLFVGMIVVQCMLYVAVPASVIEKPGLFGALKRSAQLTSGHRWWIFALTIMVGAVPGVIGAVLDNVIVQKHHGVIVESSWSTYVWGHVILAIIGGMVGSTLCATTYAHLRQLKDGVGAEELATVFA